MSNNLLNKQTLILKEDELISHLTGKNLTQDQNIENTEVLEIAIENIDSFLIEIKNKEKELVQFKNVKNLLISTFFTSAVKYEKMILIIQLVIGTEQKLDKITFYINSRNIHISLLKNTKNLIKAEEPSLELCKEIIKKLNFSKSIEFNYLYHDLSYNYRISTSTSTQSLSSDSQPKINLVYNLTMDLEYRKKFAAILFQGFQNITCLEFSLRYATNFNSISEFFKYQISEMHSLKTLKLTFEQRVVNYLSKLIYSEQQVIVRSIIQLPNLEELVFNVAKHFSMYLFQQFNQIEQAFFENSKVHKITFNFKNNLGVKFNHTNFEFLGNFSKLKNLSISSRNFTIQNLDKALLKLDKLQHLKLIANVNQEDLLPLRHSFGNLKNLEKFTVSLFSANSPTISLNYLPSDLHQLTKIQKLNITILPQSSYELNELKMLSESLPLLTFLKDLSISISNQKVKNEQLIELSLALKQLNNLKKLQLAIEKENSFDDKAVFNLAESIVLLSQLNHLSLTLHSDQITRAGTLRIQEAIKSIPQNPYIYLDISDYETYVLQSLELTDKNLTPLRNQKNYIFPYVVPSSPYYYYSYPFLTVSRKYQSNSDSQGEIESFHLKISSNPLLERKGLQEIYNGINSLNNLQTLYLSLDFNQIGEKGISILCKFIHKFPKLKELSLHLQSIWISKEGISALYNSLKKLKELVYLSLYQNEYYKMDEGQNISESLTNLRYLRIMNRVGVEKMFEPISQMKSLRLLMLTHTFSISEEGYEDYLNGLSKLKTLNNLCLYIDLNFTKDQVQQQCLQFFDIMSTLNNIVYFMYSFNHQLQSDPALQQFEKRMIKSSRLVNYKKTHNLHKY